MYTKKIIYWQPPSQSMPEMCAECGNNIEDGTEAYYHGDGTYTCSRECAEAFDK